MEKPLKKTVHYYPFGLKHKGYNNVTTGNGNSVAQKKGYQGEELEEELGKNTYAYQWRDYDPALGRFNKIDRFAEKYENYTTYHFTANNPLMYIEINGDSLDIANNAESKADVRSLVRNQNQKYITIDDNGNVRIDFSKIDDSQTISDILSNDEGLNLLNDLITSGKRFLYEAVEAILVRQKNGDKNTAAIFQDRTGIINASEYGLDSNNGRSIRPRVGYDGQVIIGPRVSFFETGKRGNTVSKSRGSIIFHELAENYERTHNGINYRGANGAHQLAITRESKFHGKSNTPGVVTRIVNPRPDRATGIKIRDKIRNYIKN